MATSLNALLGRVGHCPQARLGPIMYLGRRHALPPTMFMNRYCGLCLWIVGPSWP